MQRNERNVIAHILISEEFLWDAGHLVVVVVHVGLMSGIYISQFTRGHFENDLNQ